MSQEIETVLREMGFELIATLIKDDYDASSQAGRNGQSHWAVTVLCNGKSYTMEYHKGSAHRVYRNGARIQTSYRNLTLHDVDRLKQSKPIKPDIVEVLACMVMDTCAFYNGCTDFEDWADEFGYDNDSREAERIYHACRAEYKGLRQMGVDFERLIELFQDY